MDLVNERDIVDWNKENASKGVEVIDKAKQKSIDKKGYNFLIFFAVLGIISIIIIASAIGYSIYKDGSLVPKLITNLNLTCEKQTCTNTCPSPPSCPNCALTCPNMPSSINVYLRNET